MKQIPISTLCLPILYLTFVRVEHLLDELHHVLSNRFDLGDCFVAGDSPVHQVRWVLFSANSG
jgi:hypothetical protein